MVHSTTQQTTQLSWYDLFWRFLLTLFLLLGLSGPGLTAFQAATSAPTARTLPLGIEKVSTLDTPSINLQP